MKRYVALGDSLTQGVPGVSYLHYLKYPATLNLGRGGDTLSSLTTRLTQFKPSSEDVFLLMIGTNDLYLPYLKDQSSAWKAIVALNKLQSKIPSVDLKTFQQGYEALIQHLGPKRLALILTLPPIGEDVNSPLNQQVLNLNQIIITCAQTYQIPWLDSFELLAYPSAQPSRYVSPSPWRMIGDILISQWAWGRKFLSKQRGLRITIDGVHLNDVGAQKLALAAAEHIANLE